VLTQEAQHSEPRYSQTAGLCDGRHVGLRCAQRRPTKIL
jgi:hypothetical protein